MRSWGSRPMLTREWEVWQQNGTTPREVCKLIQVFCHVILRGAKVQLRAQSSHSIFFFGMKHAFIICTYVNVCKKLQWQQWESMLAVLVRTLFKMSIYSAHEARLNSHWLVIFGITMCFLVPLNRTSFLDDDGYVAFQDEVAWTTQSSSSSINYHSVLRVIGCVSILCLPILIQFLITFSLELVQSGRWSMTMDLSSSGGRGIEMQMLSPLLWRTGSLKKMQSVWLKLH